MLGLLVVVALIAANAAFTAIEFALVTADRTRIATAADDGSRRARVVRRLLGRLASSLSGSQLGITICSIVLGILAVPLVAEVLEPIIEPMAGDAARGISVALSLALVTVVQLVTAELIPKNLAVARPEAVSLALGPGLAVFATIFRPFITLLNGTANAVVRLLGVEPADELQRIRSRDDLGSLIRSSGAEGTLAPDATRLLTRSIRFADKVAADALVPRLDVVALPITATIDDLRRLAVESGCSRLPVFNGDLDDVVGVVLAKDVFRIAPEVRSATSVAEVLAPVVAVPETVSLAQLLVEMRQSGNQLVVVVDEHGGTAGIVTLEDVLEEIVGEIEDEHDLDVATVRGQAVGVRGVLAVEGTVRPDELEEATGLRLPDGDFETLAGFLLVLFGSVPAVGEQTSWKDWQFEVLALDRHRIAQVLVTAPPKQGWR